jgi:hypothetical protein
MGTRIVDVLLKPLRLTTILFFSSVVSIVKALAATFARGAGPAYAYV